MLETLLHGILRIFAIVLELWAEWCVYGSTETEESVFHRTACVIVPILSLGLFRVERYDNTQLLDWRTLSIHTGEIIGCIFWLLIVLALLSAIWVFLDGE